MKDYGIVFSSTEPQPIEINESVVFIANNIHPQTQVIDGMRTEGYSYNLIAYTKNEYIKILINSNQALKTDVLDTQSALCDIYEMLEGGLE